MAWGDEPTDAQLSAVYRLIQWQMTTPEAREAVSWLGEHTTRQEVSNELGRLRELFGERKLDRERCFGSEIWDGCPVKLGKVN